MDAEVYETIIGLEVHAQLLTKTKLFCSDETAFGAEPNTHISPVTLGYPGTLPVLNKEAVRLAVKMGLACHSEIETWNYFARKNYFYPGPSKRIPDFPAYDADLQRWLYKYQCRRGRKKNPAQSHPPRRRCR